VPRFRAIVEMDAADAHDVDIAIYQVVGKNFVVKKVSKVRGPQNPKNKGPWFPLFKGEAFFPYLSYSSKRKAMLAIKEHIRIGHGTKKDYTLVPRLV
jgi:hypothetical protein